MLGDKIITGEPQNDKTKDFVIGGDGTQQNGSAKNDGSTLESRIIAATNAGGVEALPNNFDDENGDWQTIKSNNPFWVLYLDYKQYKLITPHIVKKHYSLLEGFWRNKFEILNTGGNRIAFKSKYGEGTIENSLSTIKKAYEKIASPDGIEMYFRELNNARLQKGEEALKETIEDMLHDGVADKSELERRIEKGEKYELSNEETAGIIYKRIQGLGLKPYNDEAAGNNLHEKLLSVDSWMTDEKIAEANKRKKEQENTKIQILPGKYAFTVNEIGTILFNDPSEAKQIIKEDLLKPVVAQKDLVVGREVGNICANEKDLNAAFLKIVFKLNNSLPFPFSNNIHPANIKELTSVIFENDQNIKTGKDYLKKGFIEIWLNEADKNAHGKLIHIRDSAENFEQAFTALLYTFNPALPYRFADSILVKNIYELSVEINSSAANWEAAKKELYNGCITTWLNCTDQGGLTNKWLSIKGAMPSEDQGLEEFLHILNEKTDYSFISSTTGSIEYPKIQSGKKVETTIVFNLENRGYTKAVCAFSKDIAGLSLSEDSMEFNGAACINSRQFNISIDSNQLLKGTDYKTSLAIQTSANQNIEIPVSFRVVFPKNAFIKQIVLYASIFTVFFALIRLLLYSSHPDWLGDSFNYYLGFDEAFVYFTNFGLFGLSFFLLLAPILIGGYYLIKYLIKK